MPRALVLCPMTTVWSRSATHTWSHARAHASLIHSGTRAWAHAARHALAHARSNAGAPHVALGKVPARPAVHVLALSMASVVHTMLRMPLPANVLVARLLHLPHVVIHLSAHWARRAHRQTQPAMGRRLLWRWLLLLLRVLWIPLRLHGWHLLLQRVLLLRLLLLLTYGRWRKRHCLRIERKL